MSLASLLNREDKDIVRRASTPSSGETVVKANGGSESTQRDRERFVERLNRDFDVISQRDLLEHGYQDWKFINFQEFELISEWNNQSKDWSQNDESFRKLYKDMNAIQKEWNSYSKYKEYKAALVEEINEKQRKEQLKKQQLQQQEHQHQQELQEQQQQLQQENGGTLREHHNGTANDGDKKKRKRRAKRTVTQEVSAQEPDENVENLKRKRKFAEVVDADVQSGDDNSNKLQEEDTHDVSPKNEQDDRIIDEGESVTEDQENHSEEHEEPDDVEDDLAGGEDDKTSVDDAEEEMIDQEIPIAEDDEYDDNDKDFSPDDENRLKGSGKKNKNVNLDSERSRIVRELIKMCNKNRSAKAKKRRFTNSTVIEYNPLDSKLVLKITLKQFHVKKLKRLINEAKRIAALEEAAKSNPDDQLGSLSPASKKRKILAKNGAVNGNLFAEVNSLASSNINSETKDGLPTYGLRMTAKEARAIQRHYDNTLFTIWKDMARKDSAKVARLVQQMQSIRAANFKKTSSLCAREARKWQFRNFKQVKDFQTRARRGIREMASFWKRNEREERDLKKKAEKEAIEQARKEEEVRENKRQAKKLNFLLTQTELYSHFIGRKIKTNELEGTMSDSQLAHSMDLGHDGIDLDNTEANKNEFHNIDFDNEDDEQLRIKAAQNASNALAETRAKTKQFDDDANGEELNFQNPTSLGEITIEQPKILACTLKEYQLKGLNWLANLYDQGINGILADEMGLGKTVQSISVLAHLAENNNNWGPFLVVTPASTLHNWVNEITKFLPQFKILPYWGNANDRKILRRFWDRKNFRYTKDSPFHVMVTSYQMVVSDVGYLQKMKWQYMILDEAQAIKSSQSSRWKNLLSFHCRNRLLLTGTPIQNSMQELWALLHFIMPSLFDSHDEFNEWFSRDIESHAEANTKLNQQQLRRLHMILKPFMLRRVKRNVQSELGDKIEIDVLCDLTQRQAKLYQVLKSQISGAYDAIENAAGNDDASDQNLINTVMQFRKVCNHPDLFERADVSSPFRFVDFGRAGATGKNGEIADVFYSTKNPIKFHLPRLIYDDLLLPNYENSITAAAKLVNHTMNILNPNINKELTQTLSLLTGLASSKFAEILNKSLVERILDFSREKEPLPERLSLLYEGDLNFNPRYEIPVVDKLKRIQNLGKITTDGVLSSLLNIKESVYTQQYLNSLHPAFHPGASAAPISIDVKGCSNVSGKVERELFDPVMSTALSGIPVETQYNMHITKGIPVEKFPVSELHPPALNKFFSSYISMPSMDRFITESAKLKKLDEMLVDLKKGGHRVLIYFQMTKMMDLMEEYLTYRQYKHIRLDGSSKLEDRRDLVHDWQTVPDLFVFLLSTRAGGLGINLTAADTVIFYDSDWNPTIDSQAMDRAHRLGQTRQVTVYRLLVRGTIEERMRDRAKQKEHVQQVVMEGKTMDKKIKTIEAHSDEVNMELKQ